MIYLKFPGTCNKENTDYKGDSYAIPILETGAVTLVGIVGTAEYTEDEED